MHDGSCAPFEVEHTPGDEVNPVVWRLGEGGFVEVPQNHPVVGWRYVEVMHFLGTVLSFDRFGGEFPTAWAGTIGAPEAECIRSMSIAFRQRPWDSRVPDHEVCDPVCSCGYRIVHDVVDLVPYVSALADFRATRAASEVPVEVREREGIPVSGKVGSSVVLVSVMGSGNAARSVFNEHRDPDGTLRVQHVSATPTVVVSEGDPVVGALELFGAVPVVVPDVRGVHEVGRCGDELREWSRLGPGMRA